ncbi:hypothetical protein GLYMA_06G197966v4 [Glycine max]|nr:hypothetical protein GLYMA_06G197966v4 [Glycine max]
MCWTWILLFCLFTLKEKKDFSLPTNQVSFQKWMCLLFFLCLKFRDFHFFKIIFCHFCVLLTNKEPCMYQRE